MIQVPESYSTPPVVTKKRNIKIKDKQQELHAMTTDETKSMPTLQSPYNKAATPSQRQLENELSDAKTEPRCLISHQANQDTA